MRAAVLGTPVSHSLSPVLHAAAYAALGLADWTYDRVECDAAALPGWIASRDDTWAGASVTMPGKRAALDAAAAATRRARTVGAANTLVRAPDGAWSADCTDVDGIAGALRAAGIAPAGDRGRTHAVVLGAGGTAAAAVHALGDLGVGSVALVVRDPTRAAATLAVAERVGVRAHTVGLDEIGGDDLAQAGALVSTVPAGVADAVAPSLTDALPPGAVVLDAVYHPWPTPLAGAALARGLAVATGLDMLLHQAFGQVEQFTRHRAPREVMRTALEHATGVRLLDPVDPGVSAAVSSGDASAATGAQNGGSPA